MKTKMNKRQINLKIDTELDRWVRDTAKKEGTSQIAIYEEALSFARARRAIKQHIWASIRDNLRFATEDEFKAHCKSTGKTPYDAGRIISEDEFILNEMYMFLLQWHRRGFRESYLDEFFEREYWRPADTLTEDAFEQQRRLMELAEADSEESLARPITRKPRRKAEVTA